MKILVENGEYGLHNRGDIATMIMTVHRLRERWPHARIGMLTGEPRVLRAVLPEAEPVHAGGGWQWGRGGLVGQLDQLAATKLTGPAALKWRETSEAPLRQLRGIGDRLRIEAQTRIGLEPPAFSSEIPPLPPVPAAVAEAGLVIAQGGGYLADIDPYQAHRTLNLLEHAQALGIPNIMIGQGIGPIRDRELLRRAAEVLPGVDLIALREGVRGPKLLAELGVPAERVEVTGDDSVEFAYRLRRAEIGAELGLCLRDSERERFAHTLPDAMDIARGGSAEEVARRVSRCRVLVTSAYHLAVFALSQGIPAVAVTGSEYSDDRFYGLADLFGTGLRVVRLGAEHLESELPQAVRELWEFAPELRDTLQQRAVEQIDSCSAGLDRAFRLVEQRPASIR
ncbi:polysaccharide pyruvyl transferase family protein [Nocardia sp. NBC_01503]|uniref:polysaccharide pyruvyl transferase family protein n=1 Tax=Nocardia sp. NBC_01503 TaxID=2975997 RepID=UPI002E7BFD07|nr:polysaccharide pyruvyl transferase family protein [Nocardia sp. NBC_01503]WTL31847.1 polysaccharide pyruvyl transferase family protein [Nocardia sp. NBC_01503]